MTTWDEGEKDALRFLFEAGEWVHPSRARTLLQPESLVSYAGNDDGKRPFLRTRCIVFDSRLPNGQVDRTNRFVFSWFWSNCVEVASDWDAALFVRRDPQNDTVYTASGIEFSLTDIRLRSGSDFAEEVALGESALPILPSHAKPNDHKHAEYAHQAARILRSDKSVKAETVFSKVAPYDPSRTSGAVVRAIRKAFDLMYRPDGTPHQN